MSSPNLNNLIIVGCILVYVAGVLFGLNKEQASYLCQVNAYKCCLPHNNQPGLLFGHGKLQFMIYLNFIDHDFELRILDQVFFVESVIEGISIDAFLNGTMKLSVSIDCTISHQLS